MSTEQLDHAAAETASHPAIGRTYRIDPRAESLGGGCLLRLLDNGVEVGGGVYPDEVEAMDDGEAWTAPAQRDEPSQLDRIERLLETVANRLNSLLEKARAEEPILMGVRAAALAQQPLLYKVIECSHHHALEAEVQRFLAAGWRPQGGVSTARHEAGVTHYAQAVVVNGGAA